MMFVSCRADTPSLDWLAQSRLGIFCRNCGLAGARKYTLECWGRLPSLRYAHDQNCDYPKQSRFALFTRKPAMIKPTEEDREELLFSAIAGALSGGVGGYLVGSQVVIWALIFAVVVSGMVYCLRAIR